MNRISEITKLDILDIFQNGIEIAVVWEQEIVKYFYFGRLEEMDFLERLYDLESMPSSDSNLS